MAETSPVTSASSPAPAPPEPPASASLSSVWPFLGFLGFGSVLGLVTGISRTEGIGQALLTALLGFMGGGAVGVVSFVFKSDERPQLRATLLGQVLAGLSLGVWLGLVGGIYARLEFELAEEQRLAPAAADSPSSAGSAVPVGSQQAQANSGAASAEPTLTGSAPPANGTARPMDPIASADVPVTRRPKGQAPAPKGTARALLHADVAECQQQATLVMGRIESQYYDKSPEDRAADEATLRRLCGG